MKRIIKGDKNLSHLVIAMRRSIVMPKASASAVRAGPRPT